MFGCNECLNNPLIILSNVHTYFYAEVGLIKYNRKDSSRLVILTHIMK